MHRTTQIKSNYSDAIENQNSRASGPSDQALWWTGRELAMFATGLLRYDVGRMCIDLDMLDESGHASDADSEREDDGPMQMLIWEDSDGWENSDDGWSDSSTDDSHWRSEVTETTRQTDKQTERQRDRKTERQTDKQSDRHTDRPTQKQTDRQTDRQADRQAESNTTTS